MIDSYELIFYQIKKYIFILGYKLLLSHQISSFLDIF
jgi:hypothetical protein